MQPPPKSSFALCCCGAATGREGKPQWGSSRRRILRPRKLRIVRKSPPSHAPHLRDLPDQALQLPHEASWARTDPERFQTEMEADRYAEYVAMGWREPEPQDIGKVVFNRSHKRTDANLIRARATLREAYLSRHAGEAGGAEQAMLFIF